MVFGGGVWLGCCLYHKHDNAGNQYFIYVQKQRMGIGTTHDWPTSSVPSAGESRGIVTGVANVTEHRPESLN